MKRKTQLRQLNFKPKPNGDWINDSGKTIKKESIIKFNSSHWQILIKPYFKFWLVEYMVNNPYGTYSEIESLFKQTFSETSNITFDRIFDDAFQDFIKLRKRIKQSTIYEMNETNF